MSLSEQIAADLITAIKQKDKIALEAIRATKTAFTLARTSKGVNSILSVEEEIKIIQKMVKQRKESAIIYREQNRADLYEKEEAEVVVLEKYLPAKMDQKELTSIINGLITEIGATTPADFGRVMGAATKQLSGRADGKDISEIVRKLLS